MANLYYGMLNTSGVPADEATVRSTAIVYDRDAPAAMQEDMPVMQETETDHNPDLGLDPRQLASKWTEGRRGIAPEIVASVADGTQNNAIINEQVSSSGTAAARELSGVTNKNLSYAVGIEPVADLTEGGKMGNSYFVRHSRDVQDTMGSYMSAPPNYDVSTKAMVAAQGAENARKASNPYALWYEANLG